jgi:hypothetical protein
MGGGGSVLPASPDDLAAVESRLREVLRPYRASLETYSLYGVDTLRWPGARAHDWFAGVKAASRHVGFFLLPIVTHPELLDGCSPELLRLRTGKSVFSVRSVDEAVLADLAALVARAHAAYVRPPPEGRA